MIHYLSIGELADYLNISVNTAKSYARDGRLPTPDAKLGRAYGWLPATVDAWHGIRPGKPVRTDCPYWTTNDDGRRVTCQRQPGHTGQHTHDDLTWE